MFFSLSIGPALVAFQTEVLCIQNKKRERKKNYIQYWLTIIGVVVLILSFNSVQDKINDKTNKQTNTKLPIKNGSSVVLFYILNLLLHPYKIHWYCPLQTSNVVVPLAFFFYIKVDHTHTRSSSQKCLCVTDAHKWERKISDTFQAIRDYFFDRNFSHWKCYNLGWCWTCGNYSRKYLRIRHVLSEIFRLSYV